MQKKAILIRVFGRVQGVHFRATIAGSARVAGLVGYAKNLEDGSVEILAEGDEEKLWGFLQSVQRGSFLARVDGLEYHFQKFSGKHRNFDVVRQGSFVSDQISALKNLGFRAINKRAISIPRHVVIIPDGNRRWAKEHFLTTAQGHKAGADRFKELISMAKKMGVTVVTMWYFSTENWDRDKKEVEGLFRLLRGKITEMGKDLVKEKVQFRHLGRKDRLPKDLMAALVDLEQKTAKFKKYRLNMALDYGGRNEILRAIGKMSAEGKIGSEITEELFEKYLDTKGIPDPDLIIRTSGEQRLSGMLPWQGTYAELYFTPLYFPDFDAEALKMAILEYSTRQRRFGGN